MSSRHTPLFHVVIASGFGTGFSPWASGTVGAALAATIWYGVSLLVAPLCLLWITIALIGGFTLLGVWSAGVMEGVWGKDPSRVVVDEMVGMWIALLPILPVTPNNSYYSLATFFIFRLFDIFKPLGIRKLESIPGGWGILLDDILAGIYTLLCITLFRYFVAL